MAATGQARFPNLFRAVELGPVTAKNSLFYAPTSVGYADYGMLTQASMEHYGRRARAGVGAVMTEHFAVSEEGWQHERQPGVFETRHLDGIKRLAAEIQGHGALAIAQISHAGRYAGPWERWDERPRLAPSQTPFPLLGETRTPQAITPAEITRVVDEFGAAAERFVEAGWDGIEIHGGSGFLISAFLSPLINQRTDAYGGDFEGRTRFCLEVAARVSAATGSRAAAGIHLMTDELMPGGWTVDDAVALAPLLEQAGISFIRPGNGTFESFLAPENQGLMGRFAFHAEAIAAVGAAVTIPVIANGGIREPADVEEAIAKGGGGLAALSRPLLADPDWLMKVSAGSESQIRRCECAPPRCLMTQLSGTICNAWPEAVQATGYSGYSDT